EQARARDPEKRGLNFIINSTMDSAVAQPVNQIDPATGQVIPAAPAEPVDLNNVIIRLNPPLRNIRLADAIDAIAKVAERPLKYSVEDYAIVFTQKLAEAPPLYTRTFRVNPNTFQQGMEAIVGFPFGNITVGSQGGGGGGGGGGGAGGQNGQQGIFSVPRVDPTGSGFGGGQGGGAGGGGGGGGAGGAGGIGGVGISNVTRTNNMASVSIMVREFFTACGVNFPQTIIPGQNGAGGGGFAQQQQLGPNGQPLDPNANQKALFFNDRTGILFVRATLADLDIIERAIQMLNVAPPQVEIESRFAEVTQSDAKALGFQYYLGNWLSGGGKVGWQGGTAPSFGSPQSSGSTANPYGTFPGVPFSDGSSGTPINLFDTTIAPNATDQNLTAGVRNTYTDLNRNTTPIPTIATITGILTDPQFRIVISALEQRSGVDVLATPKVTTLSGRQAQVVVADVRSVVTGVDLQQNASGGNTGGGTGFQNGGGGVGSTINYLVQAIPFGPELNVIPYVSSDDVSIQMTIIPSFTEFVGYDDPGPFNPQAQSVAGNSLGIPVTAALPLPRLRTRQVVTSAIVWDGQTVVIGGLIAEESTKQRDKVPVLGDMPLIGRLFTSEASVTQKKNLLIFVTPTILDPSGKRVNDPNNMPYDVNTVPSQSGFKAN
ncbi:MAG: hypothetical protein J0L84_04875, partial [Verrucomicrobia bacterium]|nr:hypothetical protein [Verrucomicrobiota bacterium]